MHLVKSFLEKGFKLAVCGERSPGQTLFSRVQQAAQQDYLQNVSIPNKKTSWNNLRRHYIPEGHRYYFASYQSRSGYLTVTSD
jgi:hypothetical protein